MTTTYTTNFRFPIPDFNSSPWNEYVASALRSIDAIIYNALVLAGVVEWANATDYTVGNIVIDSADGTLWTCGVAHTSAASPTTFAADRTANPTYWLQANSVPAYQGDWLTATAYQVGNFVTDSDIYYVCAVAHTSGVLATDVAAGKWNVLVDLSTYATIAYADSLAAANAVDIAQNVTDIALRALASEDFLVKTASANLSAERVVTDGSGDAAITFDWSTGGVVKALVGDAAINTTQLKDGAASAGKLASAAVTAVKLDTSAMGFSLINGTLAATVAANALTVAIKSLAGTDPSATDPVYVLFRDVTTGAYAVLTITAATSVVISDGSTLGTVNSIPFRLWIVGFNDSGTFRLGVINCTTSTAIYPLSEGIPASSTAEGGAGAADSAGVFYTGSAVATKVFSILGYADFDTGQTTAGTWALNPTRTVLYGRGTKLPGDVVQEVLLASGEVDTGTTAVVDDDSLPLVSEGDEYLSQAITTTCAVNMLDISARLYLASSAAPDCVTLAIFRDGGACPVAGRQAAQGTNKVTSVQVDGFRTQVAVAGDTTFTVRGGATSGTTTLNGVTGARKFGGVLNSYLKIKEIMA